MEREEKYEYWFANIKGLTGRNKRQIREKIQSVEAFYHMKEDERKNYVEEEASTYIRKSIEEWKVDEQYNLLKEKKIHFLPFFHEEYPDMLKNLDNPPYAIYLKGKMIRKDTLKVAIVGARKCSPYGESMAIRFAERLAEQGIEIISGLARGVDGAGQRGALNVGGCSYGVLGSGVDVCYPRENIGLYEDLQEKGGILSEQPLGTAPLSRNFPARNRIISALADIVIVIEAKEKSGSLITADMALEMGKEVYALPGPVNSELSKGCNMLIRQGEGILLSPQDLLDELRISTKEDVKKKLKSKISLETEENMVYSCLDLYPKNVNQLMMETKMEIPQLINQLVSLEMQGYIREISKNYYVKSN
ncbi:DNA-processing protein DprA [Faecalimonas hominis]